LMHAVRHDWQHDSASGRVRRENLFLQAGDGIRDRNVTGVQTCALPISCGAKGAAYTAAMEKAVREKGGRIVGAYGCLGYDTFGPFKWIGGIAKGHPTQEECREAEIGRASCRERVWSSVLADLSYKQDRR